MRSKQVTLLFPGQGAQALGMQGAERTDLRDRVFEEAREILGYDLRELCAQGPAAKLNDTAFSQPAMFVCSYIALLELQLERPELFDKSQYSLRVAGLSLGEYTALVAAGVMPFADALRCVQARGKAMQTAANERKGGMMTIIGLDEDTTKSLCRSVEAQGPQFHGDSDSDASENDNDSEGEGEGDSGSDADPAASPQEQPHLLGHELPEAARDNGRAGVWVANLLFPKCQVVSGDPAALETLAEKAKGAGAAMTRALPVSGAFHTPYMAPAQDALRDALAAVRFDASAARAIVYSNVTGLEYAGLRGDEITDVLLAQLVGPVHWEPILRSVATSFRDGDVVFEVGPGKQISSMMRRVAPSKALLTAFKCVSLAAAQPATKPSSSKPSTLSNSKPATPTRNLKAAMPTATKASMRPTPGSLPRFKRRSAKVAPTPLGTAGKPSIKSKLGIAA